MGRYRIEHSLAFLKKLQIAYDACAEGTVFETRWVCSKAPQTGGLRGFSLCRWQTGALVPHIQLRYDLGIYAQFIRPVQRSPDLGKEGVQLGALAIVPALALAGIAPVAAL